VESVVRVLATGFHRLGHDVHVAAVAPSAEASSGFLQSLRDAGVEVTMLDVPGRAYVRERTLVAALCRSLRPDIVHTHGYRADIIASSAARARRIPTVTTVHGFTGGDFKNRVYEHLQQRAFRHFDAVVAVSRPIVARLGARGVARDRLHLLPNAYAAKETLLDRDAARERLGITDDAFRLGWVGRVSPEKGADVFVDALAQLDPRGAIAASVLGDGGERDAVRARAASLGVARQITWHGIVHGAGQLLAAFDVLVLSSRTEGTPMVVLEAMAAGVPIVATHVGGIPDMLSSIEALLVAPDDPAALAAAIRAVRTDPAAAAARARAARCRLAAQFGVEPWLERYAEIYRQAQYSSIALTS
jgi:glycosyltransferase involved in cell wall biosynthesis